MNHDQNLLPRGLTDECPCNRRLESSGKKLAGYQGLSGFERFLKREKIASAIADVGKEVDNAIKAFMVCDLETKLYLALD